MIGPHRSAFDHVRRMSDHRGLFEHAEGPMRREHHGYCVDDNARLLVVTSRERDQGSAHLLSRLALTFVLGAQGVDGRCRNRMDQRGRWTDEFGTDDCWGRLVWGLGATAVHHGDAAIRQRALEAFECSARQRSPWRRAMAFAALGAADVLADRVEHDPARALLVDAVAAIGEIPAGSWRWPESRLTYANAALAEALIAAGAALDDAAALDRGLTMLAWLLELETAGGHLSPTGVGGRGPDDIGPMFDQQPIEVAAMADACWRAYSVTGDRAWWRGVELAAKWFTGDNDTPLPMYDDVSGGGFDGLQPQGVNLNQGAESTHALISTMQRARAFAASS
jgi:hypothetical protein